MEGANNQPKKIIIILLLMVIIFTASFIYFKFIIKNPGEVSPDQGDIAIEQKKQDEATVEKTALLVNAKDPAQCDTVNKIVNGINYKIVCLNNIYLSLAEEKLDYGACEKLIDMPIEDCQRRVMYLILSREKSLTVCDNVPEKLKLSCPDSYWNFNAVEERDPVLCAKISTSELDVSCQNNLLLVLANRKSSLKCSTFTDKQVRSDCDNYMKGKDSCNLIKNGILRNMCSQVI